MKRNIEITTIEQLEQLAVDMIQNNETHTKWSHETEVTMRCHPDLLMRLNEKFKSSVSDQYPLKYRTEIGVVFILWFKDPFINLNKDNFWNAMYLKYPSITKRFCEWIDVYKESIGWKRLFKDDLKFHDIPIDMQIGIIHRFFGEMEAQAKSMLSTEENEYFIKWKVELESKFGYYER